MDNPYNAFQLARMADCMTPDSKESPGAAMLMGIAEEVYSSIDDLRQETYPEDYLNDLVDGWPSVYTHEMWTQFVDIATQEVPGIDGDMEKMAYDCLYQIGERLARTLWDEISESLRTCEDCEGDLSEDENVVCAECGAERDRQEREGMDAAVQDDEAQVAGDLTI